MSNTTATMGYGTLASQPGEADIYFAFEQSKTSVTPHDLIIFRSNNPLLLREMRDRTRAFMVKHDSNFKTSLIPVREDNLGRGTLYCVVPVYNGLKPELKAQLTKHFHNNQLGQWVNTAADPVAPTPRQKDKVVAHVGKPDYTKRTINRTEKINGYLKQPISSLTELCRQRKLTPSWSKVSMAAMLADWDIRNGQVPVSDEAILATEPEELPVVPAPVVEPTPVEEVEEVTVTPCIRQRRLRPDRFNNMTKAQIMEVARYNNIVLKKRQPKSEMITLLCEALNAKLDN